MFKKVALPLLAALMLTACASQQDAEEAVAGAELTACPEMDTLQICTMEYLPFCGYDAAGEQVGTFHGSLCNVCSEPGVVSYTPDACPE